MWPWRGSKRGSTNTPSVFEKTANKELTASFLFAYLAQAHKAVANSELAEWLFREAVALSPDRDFYWYELGNLLLDNRQYYQAALCFQRLVRRDDEKPVYFFKLGMAHKWLGRWAQAANNFEEALDQDPQNPEYVLQLAEALFHQRKFADLLDLLEEHPSSQSHLNAYLALQVAATQALEGEKTACTLLEKNLLKPVFAQDPERMAELGKNLPKTRIIRKPFFAWKKPCKPHPSAPIGWPNVRCRICHSSSSNKPYKRSGKPTNWSLKTRYGSTT